MLLDIDSDVLEKLEKVSAREKRSPGTILSELVREPLDALASRESSDVLIPQLGSNWTVQDGVPIYLSQGEIVTHEDVQRLLDDEDS